MKTNAKPLNGQKPEDGKFSALDLIKSIWYFISEDRLKYVLFTLLLIAALAWEFVPPYLIGKIITFLSSWEKGGTLTPLLTLILILVISNAFVAIARLNSKRVLSDISFNARYRAKVWGFERLLGFSLSWHQKESTGNKAQRILTGSEAIREWTRDLYNSILPTTIYFTGTAITCIMLSPLFAFFFVYYIGVFIIIEMWFDRQIILLSDRINMSMENASGTFVESTSNILSVKALGAKDSVTEQVVSREEKARMLSQERNKLGTRKWMFFQVHNSISWGLYLVSIAMAVIWDKIPPAMLITYAMYFSNMRMNVTQFVEQFQLMIERRSNLCRMMPYFRSNENTPSGTAHFPATWQQIRFENLDFTYSQNRVLHALNMEIQRGENLGIAGASGSGKSTIIKLLLGLYHPENGAVIVGDTRIQDIRFEEISSHISVVLQETELFNLTLKQNITMMREVNEETFARACRVACVDELIQRLPAGVETVIGERGYALSGGERQRIGIARAVCRDTPVLLMDEATSALDNATELRVMERLAAELPKDKTLVMIAHRLSTLRSCDRILVFEQGRITQSGQWEELFGNKTPQENVQETRKE